ncbi:helix-turn-helix domain-containing protein [Limosilactobacillus agrestimuris]|uniref:helix-turn-helix domain-containing protein n=1 Tax=Limosilactobacillus agrestimuris TaxID=2941331 RepID=UPI00203B44BA|nr:helix-turn-helix transcriptional regulator [Limosilactobacillus agrestimuris]
MFESKKPHNRIAELRKEKGLTLQQVADAIGVGNNTISRYENGKREPKLETWLKLASFFDVPVPYLQGVSDYTKQDEAELNKLRPLMFDKNGNPDWKIIEKVSVIEDALYSDDYSKRAFENARSIIDALFSKQPEEKSKYEDIIANSKYINGFNDLPEPVGTYNYILSIVSEMFFSAQNGDTVAKSCIKEIENMYFDKYDEHRVEEAHKKFIKSNNDEKNKPMSEHD